MSPDASGNPAGAKKIKSKRDPKSREPKSGRKKNLKLGKSPTASCSVIQQPLKSTTNASASYRGTNTYKVEVLKPAAPQKIPKKK